jgi:hypothetical protein
MWNQVSMEERLIFDVALCTRELPDIENMKNEQASIYEGIKAYLKMT